MKLLFALTRENWFVNLYKDYCTCHRIFLVQKFSNENSPRSFPRSINLQSKIQRKNFKSIDKHREKIFEMAKNKFPSLIFLKIS